MFTKDIYNSVRQVTSYADQSLNFERITDAVEILNNKGQFDALLGYLDIPVQTSNFVILPREVETPIAINVDNTPSFSRSRLYEFTLNGPGSNTERVDFSWEDRGNVPVLHEMTASESNISLKATSNTGDDGQKIFIYGKDSGGINIQDTLTLNNAVPPITTNFYSSIERIYKEPTLKPISLVTTSGVLLSTYAPDENEPSYRKIRLSRTGVTAHILFRRNRYAVVSMDDFIPIQSKMGLLLMIKALEAYRRSDFNTGKALEEQAVQMATEEQKGRNAAMELAAQTQIDSAMNLNINNRDSIIVADIYDEACAILGKVGRSEIFDRLTEAIEVLDSKSLWDGTEGWVDIMTDQFYYLTLPRYVDVPIQINISGEPTQMKNQWFEFHLNGPGSNMPMNRGWVDDKEVVTFRDVNFPIQLIAVPDLVSDNGTAIRVYGYSNGKRIQTLNLTTGKMEDGFPVTCSNISQVPALTDQLVDRIERITKATSNGFINLTGYDIARNISVPIGYYWPDETEPVYRRIKLSQPSIWVRIRYRRRTRKVTALTDPIHLKSRVAIITMLRSLAALRKDGGLAEAEALEIKAVKFLNEEQMRRNPGATFTMQFDTGTYMSDPIGSIT